MDFDLKTNEKGNLKIGEADAVDLAERFGTPLYVIDENRMGLLNQELREIN